MRSFVLHLVGIVVLASSSMVSGADARGSFERSLTVSGSPELEVSTGSGSVTVRTGPNGEVSIRAEIRAKSAYADEVGRIQANPPIEQDGNLISVGPIEDRGLRRHVSISYELVVPVDTRLVSNTGSGSQKIADIAGPLDVATGSGSLEIGRIGASVEARTGSGSIEIEGVAGNLDVTTGSGSIRAEDVAGRISASSGSGSLRLAQSGSGDVEVESGSGGVRVTGVRGGLRVHTGSGSIDVRGEIVGDWDLHASSGGITVELPDGSDFELDAQTKSGRIESSHSVTRSDASTSSSRSNRSGRSKQSLRGVVGQGGPRLEVRASSGSIRID